MAYFIDLFSPETYEAFKVSPRDVSGFRLRQKGLAERINRGDIFVCYLTRVSRWFGTLEVLDGPYIDNKPIFVPKDDPFVVRFRVRPQVLLDLEMAIPIHDKSIWNELSFTRHLQPGNVSWTGKVRSSLVRLEEIDGKFLAAEVLKQSQVGKEYALDENDRRKLATHTVNRADKVVAVSVPDDSVAIEEADAPPETGECPEVR
jgi:hypothetical protein